MPDPLLGAPARALLRQVRRLQQSQAELDEAQIQAQREVRVAYSTLRERAVRRALAELPTSALREAAGGRVRLEGLEQAGFGSVASVANLTDQELDDVPGIGPSTAARIRTAVADLVAGVEAGTRVRIELRPDDRAQTRLVLALHRLDQAERAASLRESLREPLAELDELARAARPMRGRIRRFFTRRSKREAAEAAVVRLQQRLQDVAEHRVAERLIEAVARAHEEQPRPADVWRDFEQRSPEYYGVLGTVTDLGLNVVASQGFMPSDLAQAVLEQPLDTQALTVNLRAYQSFGAKFLLTQRRVILGDEMGLGKTVQALAALAHLSVQGGGAMLVVCPASLLVNWTREIASRTTLSSILVYGTDRAADLSHWLDQNASPSQLPVWGDASSLHETAIAVTTFESLRSLHCPPGLVLGALVVDEAHYVKNPDSLRSKAVAQWAARSQRVLFMTGTPMENRIGEFRDLVSYLDPAVASGLELNHSAAGADAFRAAVGQVYLRRNAEDVLTELPGLVEVEEWEKFTPIELDAYRSAIGRGQFQEARRVAWTADPAASGKLQRLLELLDEAAENGFKVLVFSNYRAVIDVLTTQIALSRPELALHGPLTGSTPAAERQGMADAFTGTEGSAVLVAQIQAGGVGLNLQAASVVILCEPQIKPTTEAQAIARAHRMGQVRSVRVHRLLTPDSVDERLLEILAVKSQLFDDYARRSDLAESAPEAMEQSVINQVMTAEQDRLGTAPVAE